MAAQQNTVLDHLDEVVAEAALLPPEQQLQMLDAAVSRLQAEQADALRNEYGFTVTTQTIDGTERLVHRRPDGRIPTPTDTSAKPSPNPPPTSTTPTTSSPSAAAAGAAGRGGGRSPMTCRFTNRLRGN